jgi:hypothetical protein
MALVAYLQAATAERLGSDRWMPIVTLAGRYLQLTGQPPPRRHPAQSSRPAGPAMPRHLGHPAQLVVS